MAGIAKSVGKGGVNDADDVRTVRLPLMPFVRGARLAPMGLGAMDQSTIHAIAEFQKRELKLKLPDGRVDPRGKTITALLQRQVNRAPVVGVPKAVPAGDGVSVTYGPNVPAAIHIVSDYAMAVIRKAVAMAGMSAAVITDTWRRPSDQAATMYKYASKSFTDQWNMYRAPGQAVLTVFKENKELAKEQTIELMRKKIEELDAKGQKVSNHVTTRSGYEKRNIVDIGMGSTEAAAGKSYNPEGLTKAFHKLEDEGYIVKFIDETRKKNRCWHIEIVPDAKAL